jgi:hypothetical protein
MWFKIGRLGQCIETVYVWLLGFTACKVVLIYVYFMDDKIAYEGCGIKLLLNINSWIWLYFFFASDFHCNACFCKHYYEGKYFNIEFSMCIDININTYKVIKIESVLFVQSVIRFRFSVFIGSMGSIIMLYIKLEMFLGYM